METQQEQIAAFLERATVLMQKVWENTKLEPEKKRQMLYDITKAVNDAIAEKNKHVS